MPASHTIVRRMIGPLRTRGPDDQQSMVAGAVGLGHTLLATTPEAVEERMPFVHAQSGCSITADARLDNREELYDVLSHPKPLHLIGDGELILLSYLARGLDFVGALKGDFAFAIWDPRNASVFCARDTVGLRPLVYNFQSNRFFAFASDPLSLLQHPSISKHINMLRVADFIEDFEAADLSSTFYNGLYRLPPAHSLIARSGRLKIWKSSELSQGEKLRLANDDEYAEAFREVFTKAVKSRLRTNKPIGSMLSGGIDSSSVSAVAARLLRNQDSAPLQTFSAISTMENCRESRAIAEAKLIDHICPNLVRLDDLTPRSGKVWEVISNSSEPFDAHMVLPAAIYEAAEQKGHRVVLDGVGGDTTLGSCNLVSHHLGKGDVIGALREAIGERRFWGTEAPVLPKLSRRTIKAISPQLVELMLKFSSVFERLSKSKDTSIISPAFAKHIRMEERRRANGAHVFVQNDDSMQSRKKRVLHPYVTVARERYDRVASRFAIEPRDPFLDKAVLEFCLTLPATQLQKDGWPKFILRRAMQCRVPNAVRWRNGKEHLGGDFVLKIWSEFSERDTLKCEDVLRTYLSPKAVDISLCRELDEASIDVALTVHYLDNWMSRV